VTDSVLYMQGVEPKEIKVAQHLLFDPDFYCGLG
jgi:hypothetical protein